MATRSGNGSAKGAAAAAAQPPAADSRAAENGDGRGWADEQHVAAQAVEAVSGAEDVGDLRPAGPLLALGRVLAHGQSVARESAGLGAELAKVAVGRSRVEFKKQDKRFADPTWRENPAYRRLGLGYLAWSQAMERLVESADVDWRTAERARFAVNVLTSATAPTNTVLGNPAVVKRAFETGGKSLLRGAGNFLRDVRHNGGMPSQVDARPFTVGENVAATRGAVVTGTTCSSFCSTPRRQRR